MSRHERYGARDLTFSGWHRTLPDYCTAIDLDFLEYCQKCRGPLALIELARDVGQAHKPTVVMEKLAAKANIPAFLILYALDEGVIGRCRMARIYPDKTRLYVVTLERVAETICELHRSCPHCDRRA